ncbi:DUF4105 domain-containing protein [Cytophagaceae bacterium YF14B1]|uniref:DUF4105 domain-containing protein n=1 Tax=Xanthocytophaga flava TaxID=3048013 RepID=A0AAE3U7T0_9BACT|nr:DUF4105 domain-containing protein [Xanthocytophaga flavus]MDJ1480453.1 DUF4105 domain-containing protein [Xanthocytophaga flavus]
MQKMILRSFLLGMLLCIKASYVHAVTLSPKATVYLLTIAPGSDLYSTFGHTALWIQDPELRIDNVYNYGTFSFGEPTLVGQLSFGVKFARGKLPYMLSIHGMEPLVYSSQRDNRSVIAQRLNLSDDQKNKLFDLLQENYKPENRFYRYDFFYDNCTTRVRDMLQKVCGDDLRYGTNIETLTYRQWFDRYAGQLPYADMGMDLGVALPGDHVATPYESMFLPDNLMKLVAQATIVRNGKIEKFETANLVLFQATEVPVEQTFLTPAVLFWILFGFGILLTLWQWRGTGRQFWVDAIFFSIIGLLGWILLLLWVGTDHQATIKNWHLVWAWPLHLPIAMWLLKKNKPHWLRLYFLTYLGVLILLLLGWKLVPQELDYELIPLVLLLALRSGFLVYRLRLSLKQAS